MEIIITSDKYPSTLLKNLIEANFLEESNEIEFKLQPSKINYRDPDQSVLTAIISSSGVVLVTLLNGIFNLVREMKLKRLSIETKDGTKVDVPVNVSSEKISEIFNEIKALDVVRVKLEN